jgi:hypothetical protein
MIYNVTKEIESESRSNSFMGPGIQSNCELKHKDPTKHPILFGTSAKGKKFAAFHFLNDKNEVLVHTEWEPSDNDETKLTNKTLNQIKRFKHIITKYVPKEAFEGFKAENFEDFVTKSIKILGNAYVGKKVRLKVTLNDKNFTSLPNYTPFIELNSTTESTLSINTAMDKMVKDKPDQEVSNGYNPFGAPAEVKRELAMSKADLTTFEEHQNNIDDMPF